MAHVAAARALRVRAPEVMAAYRAGLLRVDSLLATSPEAWRQCRHQALAILDDCADALMLASTGAENADLREDYTRLLGSHRALQRIPASESVRAVEILWSCVEPVVQRATEQEDPVHRLAVWRRVNAAFRAAAGGRLHAGMLGYEEAHGLSAAAPPEAADPTPASEPEPVPANVALTDREREVLRGVARAMTNRQIARSLGIAEPTVKRHLSNAFAKLRASSRMDAVRKAFGDRLD